MELTEVLTERKSIRKYKETSVSSQDIRKIIEAGIVAPSAKNRQPWKFIVYTGEAKNSILQVMENGLNREKSNAILPYSSSGLQDAFYTLKIMKQASVLIMIENTNGISPFEDIGTADKRVMEICDTLSIGAAMQNMILKATEIGLGTLLVANTCFAYPELVEAMGVKGQLVGAVCVGYADESPSRRARKVYEDVVVIME